MDYSKILPEIPIPTEDQIERFKEHLLDAHSWYKHLPLLEGATFIIYLEPDLEREYYKRYSFGNTKEEYEKSFGHLYYAYNIYDEWMFDFENKIVGGVRIKPVPVLPEDFYEQWSFTLYPYCHYEFETGVLGNLESFDQINFNEVSHPQSSLLKEYFENYKKQEDLWQLFDNGQKEQIVEHHDYLYQESEMTSDLETFLKSNDNIKTYFSAVQSLNAIGKFLREIEEKKVDKAIEDIINLRRFLSPE